MPAGLEADRRHAERLGWRDVVVDTVAHHDAGRQREAERLGGGREGARIGLAQAGERTQPLVLEELADARARQAFARRGGLVGDNAELEPAPAQAAQHPVDLGAELEDVEVADHGPHPALDAVDGLRVAAAQGRDDMGVGVRREGGNGALRGLLDHGLVDAHALKPARRGDRAVDRALPRELEIERPADVEEDGAVGAQCAEPSSAFTMFSHITLASANSIMVLSRKNSSLSTPA